ncbi:MAG: electron transfer flavoprotein subunit alpha/FixB family protein [Coriobacteriales bacterium]|nr:electron transfer flavoprotein subunit alpha/FixB family protein [Coriobacteriales bacterium]
MRALVIANSSVAIKELASGAYALGASEVAVVNVGKDETPASASDKIIQFSFPDDLAVDDVYETISRVVIDYEPRLILVSPTRSLKVVAGKLAAEHETSVITDVIDAEANRATNLYFGGIALRVQQTSTSPAIYTIGTGVFDEQSGEETFRAAEIEQVPFVEPKKPLKVVASEPIVRHGKDLKESSVVIAVGRGFAEESELDMARELAIKLDAGLGCSRPLAEGSNWMPRETYIGVSGQMLAPDVYIGVGISGQMQHMIGVSGARTIIAINKDVNAPIFKQADIGIVADLKTILPVLQEYLSK